MEQLPLVFVQSEIEPDIQECFTPAYNYTRIQSSNGRLAFTPGKVYWLPETPMALIDQGWVINVSEIASYEKYGISGFTIKLVDGKVLRFSNVGGKMREGIIEAIESHKEDDIPAAEETAAAPAQEAAPVETPAPQTPPPADTFDPADINSNKVMSVFAYLGIFVLIPLIAAKESKFARFHANQGLILLLCWIVSFVIGKIPGLAFVAWILNIILLVLAIIGIINVVKGETKQLPIIGKYKIIN